MIKLKFMSFKVEICVVEDFKGTILVFFLVFSHFNILIYFQ